MKLGIVLATDTDAARVHALARVALARGDEVSLFLMDRGAAWSASPALAELVDAGCEVTVCGTNAGALPPPVAGCVEGSQDDHAALVRWADRLLAFT